YLFELDYAKGGDNHLTLTLLANGAPIPAAVLLTLTPATLPSAMIGTVQQVTLTATNANGGVVPNLPVTFTVTGVNAQERLINTAGTGQAGFAFVGTPITGTDVIQAAAHVNGADIYSNAVVANWNNGANHAPIVNTGSQQVVTLPAPGILNPQVSDDGLPNNTLSVTWTKMSGPGNVTFDNPSQAATSASFGTVGTYVLQLTATDGALTTNSN